MAGRLDAQMRHPMPPAVLAAVAALALLLPARASKDVTAAGRATLRLKPNRKARRLLRKHAVKAKLKLAFTNTTDTARATRTVRLKRLRT